MSNIKVDYMDLTEIIRRRKDGQSISQISKETGRDRKTIRKYILEINNSSSDPDSLTTKSLVKITEKAKKNKDKQAVYEPYLEEIQKLLQDEKNPLKIKSVYEVIKSKYNIGNAASSLSSFKRFIKEHNLRRNQKVTCRIERFPGAEIQIDYGKAGKLKDPMTGKPRTIYMFIGVLPSSRHKYAEFTFSQDQKSFVESNVKMLRFFNGVTKVITIDNLKTGVIKADLYDPKINKTYAEMAEHYSCFINACRVAKPKDKPTVERDMQTIREEFKKMIAINPSISIAEANYLIRNWLINEYGQRKHGTTGLKPYEVFNNIEKPLLSPLPEEPFEITEWKEAKVHPDCFIQVNKKSYSVPYQYIGKTLTVNARTKIVEIYYNNELIKTHLIPKNNRQTDYEDFPENLQMAVNNGIPAYLIKEAWRLSGKNLQEIIRKLLTPHAFINLRRALGIMSVARKYDKEILEKASAAALEQLPVYPKDFKRIILNILEQADQASASSGAMNISEETLGFIRHADYFINNME